MRDQIANCVIFLCSTVPLANQISAAHAIQPTATKATLVKGKGWQIENNSVGDNPPFDFSWSTGADSSAVLAPQNGTRIRVLRTKKYDEISDTHLFPKAISKR